MKKTDIKIITQLRNNGRIRLTQLSRKTGLPVSTIHDRIKQHTNNGLIKPSTLLQFDKLGYKARAHILVAVEHTQKEKLFSYLKGSPHVNSLFRINNGWNVLMECVFKDMYTMEEFLEKLEEKFALKKKEVFYVLDEVKREAFFSEPEMVQAVSNI